MPPKLGPAIVLSFFIAGITSGLSAWCYAEFGTRVPRAGSAYIYTYLTIGELAAFVIGWNLVLEHVIGAAAIVRGLLGYINEITNDRVEESIPKALGDSGFNPYTTIFVVFMCILVCIGENSQESQYITSRERPKSAVYLKLKNRTVFKIYPGHLYEKLGKQFRDTQIVPFMLDKTRK